ncbi:MAG: dihydroorotase [Desulfobulbaceae bacterium A2]|nr:MAG: dihydroorotase [Desulfobulbaceae bacterium A2]
MDTSCLLKNGRIIDPVALVDRVGDLLVLEGAIVPAAAAAPAGIRQIDCSGCWVVPGLIDMHVHLREPGEEYKEDIASGTRAAAAGGFTGVACMPNTKPVNDCAAVTSFILDRARFASARVWPVAAVSRGSLGEELCEYGELKAAGAVALSDDGRPVVNSQLMRRAMEYAGDHGLLVISHAEEPALSRYGVMHEGVVSTRLGLRGIPAAAEAIMVYREIALAEEIGLPVHLAHVSTAMATGLIREAKQRGVRVTAETAPHYFTLTDEAVSGYDTNAKMNPPLRSVVDREAIRQGLADGTFDAIATDHAPHSPLEKELEFDRAANGIIGLESSLSLSLELVRQGIIDARRLVELLSCNPARILGVSGGSLGPGAAADITIIDPEREYVFTVDCVKSKSRNTPFFNRSLRGRAVLTLLAGRTTHSLFESL